MNKIVKIVTLLAGVALLGGGAGWYGLASNRGPEQAVPAVNREMKELLAQVETGVPSAEAASAPASAPSIGAAPTPGPAADRPAAPSPSPPSQASAAPSSGPLPASSASESPPSPSAPHPVEPAAAASPSAIDLNAATLEQLIALPGIGESKGRAILELRGRLGAFRTVEQLKDVKGIGDKTLDKLRPLVRVGTS